MTVPTGASSEQFYVAVGGQTHGPYPASVLTQWIALGQIAPEAMVFDHGSWVGAEEFVARQARRAALTGQRRTPPPPPAPSSPPPVRPLQWTPDAPTPPGMPGPSDDTHVGVPAPAPMSASAQAVAPASPPAAPAPAPAPSAPRLVRPRDDRPPERDRIVILGRRQSGKTIYLASVYARLWRSLNGMTAKALSGEVHRQLMTVHDTLSKGQWPAATLGATQMEMEIDYAGRRRLMVTLDFAGELFRRAFVDEDVNFPGVRELTDHIDHAAAVMLLVDPAVAAGGDHESFMEDDFGLVQAVQRIRDWPGGEDVPVVLLLTKTDQHQALLDRFGGARGFIKHHFPALVRLMKQIPIFQVSAVQTDVGAEGRPVPRRDSTPVNIEAPLKFCLDVIARRETDAQTRQQEAHRRALEARMEREERERERRATRMMALAVTLILIAGAVGVFLVLWFA